MIEQSAYPIRVLLFELQREEPVHDIIDECLISRLCVCSKGSSAQHEAILVHCERDAIRHDQPMRASH